MPFMFLSSVAVLQGYQGGHTPLTFQTAPSCGSQFTLQRRERCVKEKLAIAFSDLGLPPIDPQKNIAGAATTAFL